jgi:hypothetical protein
MIHRVVLLAALTLATRAQAQLTDPEAPGARTWPVEPGPELIGAADLADLANLTEPTDHPGPGDAVLQLVEPPVEPPEPPMPMQGQMEGQMYAVPLPGRRSRDPALRKARGMLAGGIIFTAICGAASVLAIFAAIKRPNRTSGSDTADYYRASTALITCTAGSIGLAAYGAARIRRIRHLAEWTGGLGLRF